MVILNLSTGGGVVISNLSTGGGVVISNLSTGGGVVISNLDRRRGGDLESQQAGETTIWADWGSVAPEP
ncbi:hypothetical protein B5P43_32215 [Bacillus sp. SRB_336]|nr:hypothetical protein B5P43_32215 [Bacillus sp. SRB_336]